MQSRTRFIQSGEASLYFASTHHNHRIFRNAPQTIAQASTGN